MSANDSRNGVASVNDRSQRGLRGPGDQFFGDRRINGSSKPTLLPPSTPLASPDQPAIAARNEDQIGGGIGTAADETARIPRWKRAVDIIFISLTFPFWMTAMALVSVWTLLASPGPLLYRQERIGYRGRRFTLLKFRTMKLNVGTQVHEGYFERLMQADCPMTKLDWNDVRLIRGGRILRAIGLDELPQIFNVIQGEMSLVGPRPCTPHEFQRYQPAQRQRIDAPPGLTGYWQVNGKNRTTFSEMIAMDIFYAKNMSIRMDLAIMLRTAPAIATQVLDSLTRKAGARIRPIHKYFRLFRLRCRALRIGRRIH